MLLIGDRVVLRANAPPEAEYILFEIADIELRSSEPGRVREHGYQTTVERARARLAQCGVTPALARECAAAMQPALSTAYARGSAAKHVARYLDPLELFQAEHYDANTRTYRGVFVDLPTLVADLDMPTAPVALQALYLSMLLDGEADETTVFLSTEAWTKQRKPGERTHRRANTSAVKDIRTALGDLAGLDPRPVIREHLPRADVLAFVRARAEAALDNDARDLYASLERAIAVRDIPDRGPLSDPELWAIEIRLDTGDRDSILDAVEAVERTRGRTPGTTYLRARASLALRLEPPKLIAERVSALALSMTSFGELALLAAEAWLEAGDPRRAMPYARDLVDAPGVDEGLLMRAKRLLARAVGAAPEKHKTFADSLPSAPMAASQRPPPVQLRPSMPPVSVPDPNSRPRAWSVEKSRIPTRREERAPTSPGMGASPRPPPSVPAPLRQPQPRPPPLPAARAGLEMPALPPRVPELAPRAPEPSSRPPAIASRPPAVASRPPAVASRPPPVARAAPAAPAAQRARSHPAHLVPSAAQRPPPLDLELPPPADLAASFTLDLPGPESLPPKPSVPVTSAASAAPAAPAAPADGKSASQRPPVRRHSMGVVRMESRAPPGFDPRAEPESDDHIAVARPASSTTPNARLSRERIAIKETLQGKELEEARRRSGVGSGAPSSAMPRIPREENEHARPTPLRPPPAAEAPRYSARPPRSGPNAPSASASAPPIRPPIRPPNRPPMPTPTLDADLPPESTEALARTLEREKLIRRSAARHPSVELAMRGASLPPYRLENPPPLLPKAPLLPKLDGAADELAEHLALPPGMVADTRPDALPESLVEARVAFTLLARELGLDYRLRRGIELRADVSGIEAMQSVLLESFSEHGLRTAEDAYELRRHGALLSEILARRLDAEWIDISPGELGYWSMIVPPDTRVWPFGRVARLVEMGHKERDLVSYFFELQGRARGR